MSSISPQSIGLNQAVWISGRIVIGTVLEKGSFRFPGSEEHRAQTEGEALSYVRIRLERTLKGGDVRAGEELRVFSSREWFHHIHAEIIRGG